jgi:hypothetical protein
MAQMEAATALETTHDSEYQDRAIKCVDCNENFIWTAGEQVFFHDKGLKNEPKRCKPCKQAKNERLAAIAAAQSSGVRQLKDARFIVARAFWPARLPTPNPHRYNAFHN